MGATVYDKVKWHFPDGIGCPSLEHAKHHFHIIMSWLSRKGYLTDYGKEIYADGIDSDFILTSEMIAERANTLLSKHYKDWISGLTYDGSATDKFWDDMES